MQEKFFVEIKDYKFESTLVEQIKNVNYVSGCWPLVYIIHDEENMMAYVGETTDAVSRMSAHLRHSKKKILKTVKLIMSDRFNKSATLDLESNLIRYMTGDGQYKLLNANLGLSNHTYYQQKELYTEIFKSVWDELRSVGLAQSSLESISNSDLFKYSPYKSLTSEQRLNLVSVIKSLLNDNTTTVVVEGGAGTGKSIVAVYLFKLLFTDPDELNFKEFESQEIEFIDLVRELQLKYPKPRVGLVIPMSSFRKTMKNVFSNIHGLKSSMVVGPAEVVKGDFDILIVDESHRLRHRVNLGAYFGAYDKVNEKLGLDKEKSTELDWVLKQSKKQILFYDKQQSIKPSDIPGSVFENLLSKEGVSVLKLKSQLRSMGGNDFVVFVDRLLNCRLRHSDGRFESSRFELKLFDSFSRMKEVLIEKNDQYGLSRLAAGYSWPWKSKDNTDKTVFDIELDGVRLRWNSTNSDWINSENAINEVGCIHTTQGYDLNYIGVIFGNEIAYDREKNEIVVNSEHYHDRNGRNGIKSPEELKDYVINIYKTMMLRGIKGVFLYVCDPSLREYFKNFVPQFGYSDKEDAEDLKVVNDTKLTVSPYSRKLQKVPLYDSVGCGDLMYADSESSEIVEVPAWLIKAGAKYFALKTRGDSMNLLGVKDGDIILCQKNYQAPSGSNAIVLIGDDATFKQIKYENDGLVLIPKSDNPRHVVRKLTEEDGDFKVLGVFVCRLDQF